MIFSDDQKSSHTKELQRHLYEIAFYNKKIPFIIPDGIYGPETAEAVRAFQREYGIPMTGNTEFDTWEKIIEVNRAYYPDIIRPDIFKRDTLIIPGSAGAPVYMVQVMLNTIGRYYKNIPVIEVTGIYDAPTERAVRSFKNVTDNNSSAEGVDVKLWNDIVSIFNKIVL